MRPRSHAARRAASASIAASSSVRRPATAVATGSVDALVPPSSGAVRQQRLAERHVEVHGTRRAGERGRDRATRQRADVCLGRRIAVEQRQLREPLRLAPVEVVLVDRLRRAAVAQLGRPVGREHDQRHARVRAPRPPPARAPSPRCPDVDEHDDRPAIGAGHAHREEARGALVEQHPHAEAAFARSASASGVDRDPGADDGVADAGRDQLGRRTRGAAPRRSPLVRRDAQAPSRPPGA